MVKKKVVRKSSSRNNHNASKKKIRQEMHDNRHHPQRKRHAIIHSLVKAKAAHLKQSKVEEMEMAANAGVERSKALVPVKTTLPVEKKVPEPIVDMPVVEETRPIEPPKAPQQEAAPNPAIVQPDSIFADDVEDAKAVPELKEKNGGKGTKMTFVVIASIILLFWIILISASIVTNVDKTVERNTTVTTIEPITMNYSRYTQATGALSDTETSLIGYLNEEIVSEERAAANQTLFYLVDDHGNKIKLVMSGQEIITHDLKFKAGTTSVLTYNVTGTFKYDAYSKTKYTFEVDNIVRQDRPTHTVQIEKIENVTIKGKGFRIDIATGWKRLF